MKNPFNLFSIKYVLLSHNLIIYIHSLQAKNGLKNYETNSINWVNISIVNQIIGARLRYFY